MWNWVSLQFHQWCCPKTIDSSQEIQISEQQRMALWRIAPSVIHEFVKCSSQSTGSFFPLMQVSFSHLLLGQTSYLNELHSFPFLHGTWGKTNFFEAVGDLRTNGGLKWTLKNITYFQSEISRLFQYRVICPFTTSRVNTIRLNRQQIDTHIKPRRWWHLNWVLNHEKKLWKHKGRLTPCLQTYGCLKKDDIFRNEL